MAHKEEAQIIWSFEKEYTLPTWFLDRNVHTSLDLATIPDLMVFCNCKDCEEAKHSDGAIEDAEHPLDKPNVMQEKQAQNQQWQAPDEMHYRMFAELRDVICASFMPLRNGQPRQDSTIVFRMQDKDTSFLDPLWMGRVVGQVAKASKSMSIISFDLETLEELGCEFHLQDGGFATESWQPNMKSFTTFLEHFFAIHPETRVERTAWKRNQQVLSTVLDAVKVKRTAIGFGIEPEDGPDAVLIHIVDCPLVDQAMGIGVKERVLARIVDLVRARRRQGEALAILLSTNCSQYEPGMYQLNEIGGTGGSTVTAYRDKILDWDQRKEIRTGIINTQRIRRLMRHHLPWDVFCSELLEVDSNWDSSNLARTYESFGEKLWSSGDVEKAITLLVGRGWSISKAMSQGNFVDIRAVLDRLGLFRYFESDSESQATEDGGEADDDSHDDQSVMERKSLQTDVEPSAWPLVVSHARQEWEQQKAKQHQGNAALDSLMSLVGFEETKSQFMAIKHLIDTARRQDASLAQARFGAVFVGSSGSGKSTIACLYAQFLSVLGVVPSLMFEKTTGAKLARGGVNELRKIIRRLVETEDGNDSKYSPCKKMRGVFFIDEAHKMLPDEAGQTFNYLMEEIQMYQGQVIFLFAGPLKQMQSFMGLSPSLKIHAPFTFKFDDFSDGELHQILVQQLHSRFQGNMRVEGGVNGIFVRILTRRIGRGRGSGCFANYWDVQETLLRVLLRQSNRLSQSRRLQEDPDDMFLTQTDLIGPPPTSVLENSTAWKKLQDMKGLESVKQSVRALISRIQLNYERELAEESLVETSLNKVFLGNPGTGKTTVAKHYGQILKDLGLLSNGEVIVKSCNDFIGNHLGHSESLTKAILDSARGKVLIIDEAYGLARDNSFIEAVVDTIVSEVQATSTEDRAVLLLGYKDKMEEMFQKVNPGLARRFPLSSAFEFQDFSDEELRSILDWKLQAQGFTASEEARKVAMEVISRSRNQQNFGNAGEINILLDRAKEAQQIRLNELEANTRTSLVTELQAVDFDPDHNRQDRAESNIRDGFTDFVGADALIAKFQAYQRIALNSKDMGLDPKEQIPFNFIFRGPPGTGKTTTASKLGHIFFDMGFLATKAIEVCSASELIAEYVGQTGPKTQKVFQKALGKVLFIDEAYRLSEPRFGKEAVDEVVNLLTLPKYKNKLVVVLAGYDRDINHLLSTNPGFGSRFPEVIEFSNLSPSHCQELLIRRLQDKKLGVDSLCSPSVAGQIQTLFQTLSQLPAWGNARDVENLAMSLFGKVAADPVSPPCLDVAIEWVYEKMNEMIAERRKRAEDAADFQTATFPNRAATKTA